jgi:hypothetical protein
MTFTTIVSRVMDRLNLTSSDAQTRIGIVVNDVYRKVTSSIGINASRRQETTVTPSNPGTLPDVTIGFEGVYRVQLVVSGSDPILLEELTYDDLTEKAVAAGQSPRFWAVKNVTSESTIITLDAYPTTSFSLKVEGIVYTADLSGTMEPLIPESFHDVIVEGAMFEELRKMTKPELAAMSEQKYQERLSDLRMFLAKSAYLDITQGRKTRTWMGPRTQWNF